MYIDNNSDISVVELTDIGHEVDLEGFVSYAEMASVPTAYKPENRNERLSFALRCVEMWRPGSKEVLERTEYLFEDDITKEFEDLKVLFDTGAWKLVVKEKENGSSYHLLLIPENATQAEIECVLHIMVTIIEINRRVTYAADLYDLDKAEEAYRLEIENGIAAVDEACLHTLEVLGIMKNDEPDSQLISACERYSGQLLAVFAGIKERISPLTVN